MLDPATQWTNLKGRVVHHEIDNIISLPRTVITIHTWHHGSCQLLPCLSSQKGTCASVFPRVAKPRGTHQPARQMRIKTCDGLRQGDTLMATMLGSWSNHCSSEYVPAGHVLTTYEHVLRSWTRNSVSLVVSYFRVWALT